MNENGKNDSGSEMVGDIPVRSEDIGFRAQELVQCGKCSKMNSPLAAACLYCGAAIASASKLVGGQLSEFRPLEEWEKGYNVVVRSIEKEEGPRALANLVGLDLEGAGELALGGLPLARVENERLAREIEGKAKNSGAECLIVADEQLDIAHPPVRLRGMDFSDGSVVLYPFNAGDPIRTKSDDILLAVTGAIVEQSAETIEKRKRTSVKVIDEKFSQTDELLIDLYTRANSMGYRIRTHGFDFSCLGDEKSVLAVENMRRLHSKLERELPVIKVIDSYRNQQELLNAVWPIDSRRESLGFKRVGRLGRKELAHAQRTSNLDQFTRFSRLQYALL